MSRTSPTVYLSGPIGGQDYDGATEWRERAKKEFADVGIIGFSPMRCKEFLANEQIINANSTHWRDSENALVRPQGIVTRDRFDTRTVDTMLVNLLPAKITSIGTMIEIGWADAYQVPIVIAMAEDGIHQHPMIDHIAGYIVPTLDEAIAITKAILLP